VRPGNSASTSIRQRLGDDPGDRAEDGAPGTSPRPTRAVRILRKHLERRDNEFVFTADGGTWLWRGTFTQRILKPAVNGNEDQPQDLTHRRRRTRDRPSPAPRPPPAQPRHRGLLPRRTRSRTTTPQQPATPLARSQSSRQSTPKSARTSRTTTLRPRCRITNTTTLTPLVRGTPHPRRPTTQRTIFLEKAAPVPLHQSNTRRSRGDHP
jgi:hypothetical protein